MLVEALQTILSTDSPVQGMLGTVASRSDSTNGIFPTLAPDGTPAPWIVYQQVGGAPLQESFQGTGPLQQQRWRLTCYGATYLQAKRLAKYVKLALISAAGNQSAAKVFLQGVWLILEMDDTLPMPKGTIYATHVDFYFNYIDSDVS